MTTTATGPNTKRRAVQRKAVQKKALALLLDIEEARMKLLEDKLKKLDLQLELLAQRIKQLEERPTPYQPYQPPNEIPYTPNVPFPGEKPPYRPYSEIPEPKGKSEYWNSIKKILGE